MKDATLDNLSLDALAAAVERRLEEAGLLGAPQDGRVSPAPDARTVRYYTTLGLLDRPSIVDRQARYGRRHVLQLLAIKALQGQGLPLAEVQSRLYGRSDGELEALLAAARGTLAARPAPVRAVLWREMTIEPGLKLLVQPGWSAGKDPAAVEQKIRAALAALEEPARGE